MVSAARSVVVVVRHPEDDSLRIVDNVKSNYGAENSYGQMYRIVSETVGTDAENGQPITAGRIDWVGDADVSVRDAVLASRQLESRSTSMKSQAMSWLVSFLEAHPGGADTVEVKKAGKAAGYSERTLQRARQDAGVIVKSEGGAPPRYSWLLQNRLEPVLVAPDEIG
jgi:hypothetical protein